MIFRGKSSWTPVFTATEAVDQQQKGSLIELKDGSAALQPVINQEELGGTHERCPGQRR
jgi:hypothetical protein